MLDHPHHIFPSVTISIPLLFLPGTKGEARQGMARPWGRPYLG